MKLRKKLSLVKWSYAAEVTFWTAACTPRHNHCSEEWILAVWITAVRAAADAIHAWRYEGSASLGWNDNLQLLLLAEVNVQACIYRHSQFVVTPNFAPRNKKVTARKWQAKLRESAGRAAATCTSFSYCPHCSTVFRAAHIASLPRLSGSWSSTPLQFSPSHCSSFSFQDLGSQALSPRLHCHLDPLIVLPSASKT